MRAAGEIARAFLLLGASAFGGPAAHIAMMHDQIVRRRRWLSDAAFTDLIAAVNLIPGPNSTELAIHVGLRRGGFAGFVLAGFCFIVPAALIVTALAVVYVEYGRTPDARALLAGISPAIVAIILNATFQLGTTALKSAALWVTAAAATVLALLGVNELVVLFGAGLLLAGFAGWFRTLALMLAASTSGILAAAGPGAGTVSLTGLALFFLKVGSILFGSGYVLIAFLRADLVDRWGWLTEQQLIDSIAVGQFTPGPLSTTATFIGYVLAGWSGAVVATAAMFLPSFFFVWITHPLIPRLRASRTLGAFLDGVVAASLGLMTAVAITLASSALTSPLWIAVCIVAVAALAIWRVNSVWLVVAGGILGLAFR